jgi:hypothetical protein
MAGQPEPLQLFDLGDQSAATESRSMAPNTPSPTRTPTRTSRTETPTRAVREPNVDHRPRRRVLPAQESRSGCSNLDPATPHEPTTTSSSSGNHATSSSMISMARTPAGSSKSPTQRPATTAPGPQTTPERTDTRTEKVSVSLPTDLTSDVRKRVGSRGFSGYVTRAVRRQLERDNLDALLAEMEAANGPVPDELLAEVEALWPASGAPSRP